MKRDEKLAELAQVELALREHLCRTERVLKQIDDLFGPLVRRLQDSWKQLKEEAVATSTRIAEKAVQRQNELKLEVALEQHRGTGQDETEIEKEPQNPQNPKKDKQATPSSEEKTSDWNWRKLDHLVFVPSKDRSVYLLPREDWIPKKQLFVGRTEPTRCTLEWYPLSEKLRVRARDSLGGTRSVGGDLFRCGTWKEPLGEYEFHDLVDMSDGSYCFPPGILECDLTETTETTETTEKTKGKEPETKENFMIFLNGCKLEHLSCLEALKARQQALQDESDDDDDSDEEGYGDPEEKGLGFSEAARLRRYKEETLREWLALCRKWQTPLSILFEYRRTQIHRK